MYSRITYAPWYCSRTAELSVHCRITVHCCITHASQNYPCTAELLKHYFIKVFLTLFEHRLARQIIAGEQRVRIGYFFVV